MVLSAPSSGPLVFMYVTPTCPACPPLGSLGCPVSLQGLLLQRLGSMVQYLLEDWFYILNPLTSAWLPSHKFWVMAAWGWSSPVLLSRCSAAGSLGPHLPCSVAELWQQDQHMSKSLWHKRHTSAGRGKLKWLPHWTATWKQGQSL